MTPGGGPLIARSGGARIFLLAMGGAVDWTAAVTGDPAGAITLSASAGTLTARSATAMVTVTADQFVSCLAASYPTITINPGGRQFFICTGWIRPGTGHRGHPATPATPATVIIAVTTVTPTAAPVT